MIISFMSRWGKESIWLKKENKKLRQLDENVNVLNAIIDNVETLFNIFLIYSPIFFQFYIERSGVIFSQLFPSVFLIPFFSALAVFSVKLFLNFHLLHVFFFLSYAEYAIVWFWCSTSSDLCFAVNIFSLTFV